MPPRATASPPRTAHLGAGAVEDVARRLGAVVQRSPADETEVVWLETVDARVTAGEAAEAEEGGGGDTEGTVRRSTVQVRVRERGRVGTYRTGANTQAEVDTAVRQALGQARFADPGPPLPLARPGSKRPVPAGLHDPAVADLDPDTARDLLHGGLKAGETLTLDWHLLRLVVANSQGLSRATEATALTLAARAGGGPGAGRAAGSARGLGELAAPRILERARDRAAEGDAEGVGVGEGNAGKVGDLPLLLHPEAAAVLVQRLADGALSSRTFVPERSFLSGRIGQRVFHPSFTLVDDGTDEAGLPFPFDCDGWPKRRVEMVRAGVLESPAIDVHLGRALDRTPTPHAVGFDESRAGNLFVAAGEAADRDLLRAVDGGVAVGALDDLRLTDPARGLFRAVARGVRRVRGGALAEPVADLLWRGSLETVLGELAGVGADRVSLACHGAWGAVTAPALALTATGRLETLG